MIAVVDLIMVILVGLGFWGLFTVLKAKVSPQQVDQPEPYTKPAQHPNTPRAHFRLIQHSPLWVELGCPREIGTQVEVNMASGNVAIYELRNVEPSPDWSFYDFEFVRYKDTPTGASDYPQAL